MARRIEKIREEGASELAAREKDLTEQIFRLRFQLTTGQAEALKRLREEGHAHVDEAAIFRAVEAMREIANEAVRTSKTARRQRERRLRVIQGGQTMTARNNPPPAESTYPPSDGRQPHEHMFPFEEWS